MSKKTDRIEKKAAATVAARHAKADRAATSADSTNVVDFPPSPVVTSTRSSETSISGDTKMTYTATRTNANRKGSSLVFSINGVKGLLKGPASMFAGTPAADLSFTIEAPDGIFANGSTPKSKMTKEERAAAKAAETPQMKLDKAKAAAAKQAARVAKLEAALNAPAGA